MKKSGVGDETSFIAVTVSMLLHRASCTYTGQYGGQIDARGMDTRRRSFGWSIMEEKKSISV
jgi:hypothetical protein